MYGLAASCPEGSSTNPSYTGPVDPMGSKCRCAAGRVWLNGYCQSPQSVSQQAGAGVYKSYGAMSTEEQMAQDLTPAAKQYFQMTKHTVSCKLVYPSPVPGGPNYPTRMCSIDGGPYEHGAYAINLNPETAIISAARNKATLQVAKSAGVAPGAVAGNEVLSQQVTSQVIQQTRDVVQSVVDWFGELGQESQNGGQQQQQNGNGSEEPTDSGLDLFGRTVEIFGYDVPILLLVGIPAAYLLTRGNQS